MTVDTRGVAHLRAFLADKTSVAITAALSKNGHCPLYASLYGGKGALLGWATFADNATTDFDGVISWSKAALTTSQYYPDGFTSDAALLGSRYGPPVGSTNRILSVTKAAVVLTGGNLAQSFTNDVVLGLSSRVTNTSPNQLTMAFTLSSGLFGGSFTAAGDTKAVLFKGAVLQKANYGSGCVMGTNLSGRVSIEAAP